MVIVIVNVMDANTCETNNVDLLRQRMLLTVLIYYIEMTSKMVDLSHHGQNSTCYNYSATNYIKTGENYDKT